MFILHSVISNHWSAHPQSHDFIIENGVVDLVLIKQLYKAHSLIHCVLYRSNLNPNTQHHATGHSSYLKTYYFHTKISTFHCG